MSAHPDDGDDWDERDGSDPVPPRKAVDPLSARSFGERLIAGMTLWVVVLTIGVAVGFDAPGSGSQAVEAAADVLGAVDARPDPAEPTATTATTLNPLAAYLATSTTSTSTTTTTTTAPPSTTTTTTPPAAPPAALMPASATATTSAVTLELEVTPAEQTRSLRASLSARFDDSRVLRGVSVDFGDGNVVPAAVQEVECNDPAAPNPYELALPAHTYASPGTYPLTVVATTATCTPDDDDWGLEEQAEVRISMVAP